MKKFTLLFALVFASGLFAQVTTVPGIIQKGYDGAITIVFNPNEGNKGMASASACYAHTGLITNASSSDGDWKHTISNWRDGSTKGQMTKDGNVWKLEIPNIYTFYGCSTDTEIKKMAFVFHDGPNGSLEGKTAENTDIFVELVEAGLATSIVADIPEISVLGSQLTLNCYATLPSTLTLSLNGQVLQTATGTEMTYTHTLSELGNYDFVLTATAGDETKTATASTCVPMAPTKANRPTGIVNGIYYDENDDTKVTLCTYAGSKLVATETSDITIKAKLPSHWTNTITAWVWSTGAEGKEVVPTKQGDWYVYTQECAELNIIFKNGTGWNGDNNQTEDITIRSNTNIQVTQSGSGKAKYTVLGSDITLRAQMPAHWTETITALVTTADGNTTTVTPTLEDGWYVFTESSTALTVSYINGAGNGDMNVSEPITLTESSSLQVTQEGNAKAQCYVLIASPAKHVFVVGDFNDWTISNEYQLHQANDSAYFWIELTGLTPQQEYAMQYVVVRSDGQVKRISDIYSEKVLHPDDKYEPKKADPTLMDYPAKGDGYVTVIQTAKPEYEWSEATLNFKRPDKNNLIIYELWVYDYTPERTLAAVMERMDYFVSLGVNAIELMPVTEFDGNYNWGYSPNHYFAFDKAYGSPDDMKAFVDTCHKHGIAVIVDMVFNHATGLNSMNKLYPYGDDLAYNPWFNVNPPHSDNVYEDWNHDFAPTKTMFTRALQYWLTEYKVDGFRMDLSHGLCGTTNNAMTHIADYYNNGVKAVSEDAYFILEHWGGNMGSDRPELIRQGMMCWQNTNEDYRETTAGYTNRGFSNANQLGYVSYCESHDEERMQYHAKKYGTSDLKTNTNARLNRIAVNVVFNLLLAGPHMIWQFEEIGYDFSINSSEDNPSGTSSDNRCAKKPRPESRGYFRDDARRHQFIKIAQAIHLRTQLLSDQFVELGKPTKVDIGGKALRTIQWGSEVFVAGNFSATANQTLTIPAGTWYNYYAQTPQQSTSVTLLPGELLILTGAPIEKPMIQNELTAIEDIMIDATIDMLPPYNVNVYSINGQLISVQKNVMEADLTGMREGAYIVEYEKNGLRVSKKVIR